MRGFNKMAIIDKIFEAMRTDKDLRDYYAKRVKFYSTPTPITKALVKTSHYIHKKMHNKNVLIENIYVFISENAYNKFNSERHIAQLYTESVKYRDFDRDLDGFRLNGVNFINRR